MCYGHCCCWQTAILMYILYYWCYADEAKNRINDTSKSWGTECNLHHDISVAFENAYTYQTARILSSYIVACWFQVKSLKAYVLPSTDGKKKLRGINSTEMMDYENDINQSIKYTTFKRDDWYLYFFDRGN